MIESVRYSALEHPPRRQLDRFARRGTAAEKQGETCRVIGSKFRTNSMKLHRSLARSRFVSIQYSIQGFSVRIQRFRSIPRFLLFLRLWGASEPRQPLNFVQIPAGMDHDYSWASDRPTSDHRRNGKIRRVYYESGCSRGENLTGSSSERERCDSSVLK